MLCGKFISSTDLNVFSLLNIKDLIFLTGSERIGWMWQKSWRNFSQTKVTFFINVRLTIFYRYGNVLSYHLSSEYVHHHLSNVSGTSWILKLQRKLPQITKGSVLRLKIIIHMQQVRNRSKLIGWPVIYVSHVAWKYWLTSAIYIVLYCANVQISSASLSLWVK